MSLPARLPWGVGVEGKGGDLALPASAIAPHLHLRVRADNTRELPSLSPVAGRRKVDAHGKRVEAAAGDGRGNAGKRHVKLARAVAGDGRIEDAVIGRAGDGDFRIIRAVLSSACWERNRMSQNQAQQHDSNRSHLDHFALPPRRHFCLKLFRRKLEFANLRPEATSLLGLSWRDVRAENVKGCVHSVRSLHEVDPANQQALVCARGQEGAGAVEAARI